MSGPFKSSVAYRNDFCATVAQLQQRASRPLPDGATVYVTDTQGLYRLFKNVGTEFDLLTTLVVIPADQSSNRWILQESAGTTSPWAAVEVMDEAIVTTPTAQFAWRSLGINGGSYSLAVGSAAAFAIDASTSVLTYRGPTRQMLASLQTTVVNNIATSLRLDAIISRNGDVPDGDTNEFRNFGENGASLIAASGAAAEISTERIVLLNSGDTLRVKYRNMSTADGFTVDFMTLVLTPL